jgi:hypothetical protein
MYKLLFLLNCMLISNVYQKTEPTNFSGGQVLFVTVDKVPVVKGTLNGKEAYFIIDSGASISILDRAQVGKYKFQIGDTMNGSISGYGGESSPNEANNINLIIGDVKFDGKYRTQDISNIVSSIQSSSGIKIVGIIGSNVMKKKGIIIDYDNNSLYIGLFVTIKINKK